MKRCVMTKNRYQKGRRKVSVDAGSCVDNVVKLCVACKNYEHTALHFRKHFCRDNYRVNVRVF